MKVYRDVLRGEQEKKVIGKVILDEGFVVFEDIPEYLEGVFYQGFYSDEDDDESFLAPDTNPEKYFKLLPLMGYADISFSTIKKES